MNIKIKLLLSILAGAGLGYMYYYFVGCNSGTCPITSTWYITTLYGAVFGLVFAFPTKSKKDAENDKKIDDN